MIRANFEKGVLGGTLVRIQDSTTFEFCSIWYETASYDRNHKRIRLSDKEGGTITWIPLKWLTAN